MQVLPSCNNKFNNSFGIKLNINNSAIAGNPRLRYIKEQVEFAIKEYPKDTLDIYVGYVEYFKNKSNESLLLQFKDVHFLDELLKFDDDTIIKKFVKIAKILRKAFKMEDETYKRILNGDEYVSTIYNLKVNEANPAYSSIGEYYAYQNLKNDSTIEPFLYYAKFLPKQTS